MTLELPGELRVESGLRMELPEDHDASDQGL